MRIWFLVEINDGIPSVKRVPSYDEGEKEFTALIHELGYQRVSSVKHMFLARDTSDSDHYAVSLEYLDIEDDISTAQKLNVALGRLAPKGTWLCEILEKIWHAKSTEEAVQVATAAQDFISKSGLWEGDRKCPTLQKKRTKRSRSKKP